MQVSRIEGDRRLSDHRVFCMRVGSLSHQESFTSCAIRNLYLTNASNLIG